MLKSRLTWQKEVRCRDRWGSSCFKVTQNRPGSEAGQWEGKRAGKMAPGQQDCGRTALPEGVE